jgi:hypothetical protein
MTREAASGFGSDGSPLITSGDGEKRDKCPLDNLQVSPKTGRCLPYPSSMTKGGLVTRDLYRGVKLAAFDLSKLELHFSDKDLLNAERRTNRAYPEKGCHPE